MSEQSMVERVARALSLVNHEQHLADWNDYVDDARAAITAMYQATPQILEAISRSVVETTDSEATWTAALDAALEQ